MAVSFRVVGTWAELTADGSVAIPATPQAGDRMYLFARWKDFSVTAQVTSPVAWSEIAEFADGAVGAGNGTGSVKVACWYRDWQSGDTDPTIDFSANPDNASAVIMVMSKAATDDWLTPVAVTAAMTNWTTSSQTVAASSTANVLGGGVVMGLIGIRDDTATMTRPTNGIDDSAGAITWNGNYVEAPATHHSTTTGFDGAADLGYRLVSAGATATLRMTGTISAAETGAALWVAQGVEANLLVDSGAHDQSATSIALTQVHELVVASATHAHAAGGLALAQVHALTVSDGAHAHSVEDLTLTQAHVLTVDAGSHAHTAENLTVEVIHHLDTQDASHSHTAESLLLTQEHNLSIADGSHAHTAQSPFVRTFLITYLDPGGDAVQAIGYFNTTVTGTHSFDSAQQAVGVGSYKFDSGAGAVSNVDVAGVLGPSRRVSFYFRYDSVPTASELSAEFFVGTTIYSGGGFVDPAYLNGGDGFYATATPARNAGQGHKCPPVSTIGVAIGGVVDSVKIIYERKYDVNTSIGISRVKWVVNGEEGPDHDNTDMPLTDTVVEVDVTADRGWTWQDFQPGMFEIIAEARRGDTDTAHTQSWDYLKVEVVWHNPTIIMQGLNATGVTRIFALAITPKGSNVCLRYADADGDSYDGITPLPPNTWNRISFGYTLNALDNFDINLYVNGIEELSITGAASGADNVPNLEYGWLGIPGVDHLCWFDQIYIDDGSNLSDPGDMRITAKLPASVNENNWNTTGGTGAVDERPLSETNFKQHASVTGVRQTYTLQTAATGDVDISGETPKGYMGWVWFKLAGTDAGDALALVVNNAESNIVAQINFSTSPLLLKSAVTSTSYPSHAAGIGMRSNDDVADTFMYECGVVVAYRPTVVNPNSLMAYQILAQDSITTVTDDLRSDPQTSYELCYRIDESEANVLITIYSIPADGQPAQLQGICGGQGGYGRTRITPGVEVQVVVAVTGGSTGVSVWRRVNID